MKIIVEVVLEGNDNTVKSINEYLKETLVENFIEGDEDIISINIIDKSFPALEKRINKLLTEENKFTESGLKLEDAYKLKGILFDIVVGAKWDEFIPKPAFAHLSTHQIIGCHILLDIWEQNYTIFENHKKTTQHYRWNKSFKSS
jgi:hypothetical protein